MADTLAVIAKAAVAEVNALPIGIKNRAMAAAAAAAEDDDGAMSILSFDSEASAPTPTPFSPPVRKRPAKAPLRKVERARKRYATHKTMQIFVRDTMSSIHTLDVTPDLEVRELKVRIQAKTGCPPCEMRLIFAGQQLEDSRTLQDVSDPQPPAVPLKTLVSMARKTLTMIGSTISRRKRPSTMCCVFAGAKQHRRAQAGAWADQRVGPEDDTSSSTGIAWCYGAPRGGSRRR